MRVLVDTNVIARAAQVSHDQHETAMKAVKALTSRQLVPCLVPQNLYEFWVVCTRPLGENGLGMPIEWARERLEELKSAFEVLEETPAVWPAWEALVIQHDVKGKSAHDARLVAAMKVHGVTMLMTFNTLHFNRYPGMKVLTPEDAVAGALPSA